MTDDADDTGDGEVGTPGADEGEFTEPLPEEFLSAAVLRPKPAFLEWVRSVTPPGKRSTGPWPPSSCSRRSLPASRS